MKELQIIILMLNLRQQTIQALNLQYKTHNFSCKMTPLQMVQCTEHAMKSALDIIDYELNNHIISQYGIKIQICEEDPFTIEQRKDLQFIIQIADKLIACSAGDVVCKQLQKLNQLVLNSSLKIKITERYHKFTLFFKYLTVKQALLLETLRGCQVFYTMVKERRKSGKQYFMDPLINIFQDITQKLQIKHPFHQRLMNRRQVRHLQKKITAKKMNNPLFDAVSEGKVQLARQLIDSGIAIESPGIVQDGQLKRQMNCSHRACQLGDLQMCKLLHSYKVDWQARDRQAYTPLHFAVQSNNIEVVKFLIEEVKVNKQAKNNQGRSAFYIACKVDGLEVIKYLVDGGCDINSKTKLGRTALAKACYLGYLDIATYLLSCPEVITEVEDGKQRTPLYNSAFGPKGRRQDPRLGVNQKDSPQCTELLLKNGANVDHRDEKSNTPLHVSASSDGIQSIRILIKYGASLERLNFYGETPLMTAAKFGHPTTVKLLHEQYGASITLRDKFDKNLMLLCTMFRQQDRIHINNAYHYITDKLLSMAAQNKKLQKLPQFSHSITNWQEQIDLTFGLMLQNHYRSDIEFRYFCEKCMKLGLKVQKIRMEQVQQLFNLIVNRQEKQYYEIIDYFLLKNGKVKAEKKDIQEFASWILQQNSVKLLQYISVIQQQLIDVLTGEHHQEQQTTFRKCLQQSFWKMLPQLKQKVVTHCLLKFNINWIDYVETDRGYNIIHLLVRYKKLGSLIQVFKVFSGSNLKYVTNYHILQLIQTHSETNNNKNISNILSKMLTFKDIQGFDPFNLSLLLKDAPSTRLIQEHIKPNSQTGLTKYQVRQYSLIEQTDIILVEEYKKGYNIQNDLQQFVKEIQNCQSFQELSKLYPFVEDRKEKQSKLDVKAYQLNFEKLWQTCNQRKIQVILLKELQKEHIIGLDIEYFHCSESLVISIMQISTPAQDYIIDFLHTANNKDTNYEFTQSVSAVLSKITQNKRIAKVMHGSDNDLYILRSVLKLNFLNFIDTARIDIELTQKNQIRGLSTLANQYLKQTMNKDYQVSQWKIRPLPTSMLDYARRDSFVLPYLAKVMVNLLEWNSIKSTLISNNFHAKKNKRNNQPLVRSIQVVQQIK